MMKVAKTKKALIAAGFLFLLFFSGKYLLGRSARADALNFSDAEKMIALSDNGFTFNLLTKADNVAEFLQEKNIKLSEYDKLIPEKGSLVYPGMQIRIERAVKIKIQVDGKTIENQTAEKTVAGALAEKNIALGRLDKVSPAADSQPQPNSLIIVTRINVEETTVTENIDFKTITKEDPKLGWHEQKITQPGIKGAQEIKYRITYKNGQEISRVILEKNVIQQPTAQIVTQGTYMQLGKADKGQGTWYAWKGGLFAASTSLPRGAYAKVTNQANGKSVVVQINDYGPQGKGRIIDLDKVAFQKIASLGAGVIGVKVEQILN